MQITNWTLYASGMHGHVKRRAGPRRPTMADVGRLAGVSPTTVSFVINAEDSQTISPATQQRVLDAVEKLGYRPNRAAQNLRTQRTSTIGFVTDEIAVEPFAGQVISGAHDQAWSQGSMLLVVNTMRSRAVIEAAIEDLLDRQVDAIIFAAAGTRRVTLPTTVARVPTLLVSCFTAGNAIPCVLPDEVGGGRAATQLLLDAGHRQIAYLTGSPGAWATRGRLRGHREALLAAGLDPHDQLVVPGNHHADSGYDLTRGLLRARHLPTAIVCGNDRMALGAYLALAEAGVRIPEDISVVGYDDQDPLVTEIRPALSTMRLPYYEMGQWAARELLSGTTEHLPPRTYLPCPPSPRRSVGPPRTGPARVPTL